MPSYKLSYFDFSGLAEPARLLLNYGKIPFTDERVQRADWPALKPKMPLGSMPVLEVDGKQLPQSVAIFRYLGNVVGLVGKDAWENAQIDAAVDTINDVRTKLAQYRFQETDETKKAALKKTLEAETIPFFFSRLDAQAKANNGYLANKKLSWADIVFAAYDDLMTFMFEKDILVDYPNLQQVKKNVVSIPQIKSYLETRPKDKF